MSLPSSTYSLFIPPPPPPLPPPSESQMEEKRLRKEKEKEKLRQEEETATWADRFDPPANSTRAHQAPPPELRTSSAPEVAPPSVAGPEKGNFQPPVDLNASGNQTGSVYVLAVCFVVDVVVVV